MTLDTYITLNQCVVALFVVVVVDSHYFTYYFCHHSTSIPNTVVKVEYNRFHSTIAVGGIYKLTLVCRNEA